MRQTPTVTILHGDALAMLRTLDSESVQCVVSSPPYWGLRNYNCEGQIGLEKTPAEYIAKMVGVFDEVRRVLKKGGTAWVNMGDCYATGAGKVGKHPGGGERGEKWSGYRGGHEGKHGYLGAAGKTMGPMTQPNRMPIAGLKPKDMVGMPWRLAFALQESGWYLRSDIIWSKPSCMPESVNDRPTKSHEYIFLLTKSERYYYDAEAIKEPCSPGTHARLAQNVQDQIGSNRANGGAKTNGNMKTVARKSWKGSKFNDGKNLEVHPNVGQNRVKDNLSMDSALAIMPEYRNKRTVWTVAAEPFKGAHFAVYPTALVRPCILAGSKPGDVVLDPFSGSGTTAAVAIELGRSAIAIELNADYIELIKERTNITPGFQFK